MQRMKAQIPISICHFDFRTLSISVIYFYYAMLLNTNFKIERFDDVQVITAGVANVCFFKTNMCILIFLNFLNKQKFES